MELTGKIIDFKMYQKPRLIIEVNERNNLLSDEFEKLLKKDKISLEMKQFRKKRSSDANSYCWKLCTEIANLLGKTKDEVYLDMLKAYGQSCMVPIKSDIDVSGYFKYYDAKGTRNGFTYYVVYKGSSEYDSKEMYILIEGICSECKELGIPTLEDLEINRMIEQWEEGMK